MKKDFDKDFNKELICKWIEDGLSNRCERFMQEPFNVFVNEAHLQCFLGEKLLEEFSGIKVDFESKLNDTKRVDIVITSNDNKYPIEIKYSAYNKDNKYLAGTEAVTKCRCGFLNDIMRIEEASPNFKKGYCIFLTNNADIYKENHDKGVSEDFKIHGGVSINKGYFGEYLGKDTLRKHYRFNNEYKFNWSEIKFHPEKNNPCFKVLITEVLPIMSCKK